MKKYWIVSVRRGPSYLSSTGGRGSFPFNPKFQKFRLVHQMEWTISVWSDWNIRDQLWRWSTLTGPVISVSWAKMFHSIWQNCCPQYHSFVFSLQENQTCSGLGWVCATRMYHSTGHMEFPKFQTRIFVEWKVPIKSGLVMPYNMVILSQSSLREK